jgi:hypothetical protein
VSFWFKSKKKSADTPKALGIPVPAVSNVIEIDEGDEDDGWHEREFTNDDLVKFNNKTGQFIFEKDGITMILLKESPKYFNFDAF